MKVLLEVFRNTPAGKSCLTLSRNVLDVLASNVEQDIEVKFLPLSSAEAEKRGVEIAPALVVNGRTVVEGIPSPEEIVRLIEKATPVSLGIILTKAPHEGEHAENALDMALEALAMGDTVGLFLLSDGVWVAKEGQQGPVGQKLDAFVGSGGKVFVSSEHLEAGGLGAERLIRGVTVASDPYDTLIDLVMEAWEKTLMF